MAHKKSKIRRYSTGERVFDGFNTLIMVILGLSTIYPFWDLLSQSLASANVSATQFYLIPPEMTLQNYVKVFQNEAIPRSYLNTIIKTAAGTILSILMTFGMAYPLSKGNFPHRTFWTGVVVFTMFFSGGLIPSYLLINDLKMMDTLWALMLPGLISPFNFVIVRNYYQSLPASLEESAKLDGANDIIILWKIILPVCKPIIATIGLWVAVDHWNAWYDSMLYSRSNNSMVVQLVLRRILDMGEGVTNETGIEASQIVTPGNLKAATVMVTTIPILCVYPFIQKYFVKGIMVGSLKG